MDAMVISGMVFGFGKRVLQQHCLRVCAFPHPSYCLHRCLVFVRYKSLLELCALVTMIMRMVSQTTFSRRGRKGSREVWKGQLISSACRPSYARINEAQQANCSFNTKFKTCSLSTIGTGLNVPQVAHRSPSFTLSRLLSQSFCPVRWYFHKT